MPLVAVHAMYMHVVFLCVARRPSTVGLEHYTCTKYSRCQSPRSDFTDLFCLVRLLENNSAFECAMAGLGGHEIRELATPLISSSQPAGAFQQ